MARHFLRLKLSLLASALRRGWQAAVGLLVAAVLVLPFAAFGAFGLFTASRGEDGVVLAPLVFALLGLGWMIFPPLTFGVDETLDPARLRLLPLTRRQLLLGQTVAGAVGVGPVATLLVLAGAGAGTVRSPLGAVAVVVAVAVQLLLCLVVARAVTTALSRRLRSRKGRDFAAIVGALLGLLAAGLGQVPNLVVNAVDVEQNPQVLLDALARVTDVAGLTPFGWAGRGLVAVGEGAVLVGLAEILAAGLVTLGLARWWSASLETAMTAPASDPGEAAGDDDLFPTLLRWAPRTRLGAAAARELRYAWRVPQLRAQWVTLPVFGAALVVVAAVVDWMGPQTPLMVPMLVAFAGFGALNQFGADRGATWLLLATGDDLRSDLAGKNLAAAVLLVPFAVTVAVVVGAVTGGWGAVVPAILGSVAVGLVAYGVGDVASVLAPQPLPESANLWAGTTGTGCATALIQLVAILAECVLLAPVVVGVAAAAFLRPGLLVPVVLVGLAYAGLVWWAGLRIAAARASTRGPELLAALSAKAV